MMLIGQSLYGDADTGAAYDGPWNDRQADAATFFIEIVRTLNSNTEIDVIVQHKNREEADSAAVTAASFSTIASATTGRQRATGLKELWRYRWTVTHTGSGGTWAHVRAMAPAWERN